jgi:hypothetical protein
MAKAIIMMLIEPPQLKPDNNCCQQPGSDGQYGMEKAQHFKTFSSSSFEKSAAILVILALLRSSSGASTPDSRYIEMR